MLEVDGVGHGMTLANADMPCEVWRGLPCFFR
jgi:hypothetical protein